MGYTKKFTNCQDAADEMVWYITDQAESTITVALIEGCSENELHFLASFAGVRGYPVRCWIAETKKLYTTY